MTTEEKAKAYDEALEKAKRWADGTLLPERTTPKGVCELIFPGLVESEDEKIRKAMLAEYKERLELETLAYKNPECNKDTVSFLEKAVDYLERQKEQKPILEVFGFKVGDVVRLKDGDGRKHIIKSFEKVEGLHGPNFYNVEFEDNSAKDSIYPGEEYPNGYYTQMEKFEKEQKSAEWSENFDEEVEKIHKRYPEVSFAKLTRIAYHFSKWANRRKNTEWSEKDERKLNRIYEILGYAADDKGFLTSKRIIGDKEAIELQDFLRSVVKPKQEWSEEDDAMLTDNQMYFLKSLPERFNLQSKQESEPMKIKYAGKIYKVYGTKEFPGGVVGYKIKDEPGQFDYIINPDEVLGGGYNIKSNGSFYSAKEANLDPPHWKPSKEQIGALERAIVKMHTANDIGILAELRDNLKKL